MWRIFGGADFFEWRETTTICEQGGREGRGVGDGLEIYVVVAYISLPDGSMLNVGSSPPSDIGIIAICENCFKENTSLNGNGVFRCNKCRCSKS